MRIAIIGGGFAGASLATLLKDRHEVTLFEKGSSTSSIAAGLLHKFVGLNARKSPFADEAFEDTVQFISKEAPNSIKITPLLRLALTEVQVESFKITATNYPEVKWIEDASALGPYPKAPGILVSGAIIDCASYLDTLKKSLPVVHQEIKDLKELNQFDRIVIAAGPQKYPGMEDLNLNLVKGQLLEITCPIDIPYPINSQAYFIPQQDHAILGSTYERNFTSLEADLDTALKELGPSFTRFFPHLSIQNPIVKAGVRVTTPDRLPILEKIDARTLVYTGLGSKGLLYHVYFAKKTIKLLLDES